jgi:hypothetical protein
MKIQNEEKFIKGVESLIEPMEVSNLLFFQRFKGLLPSSLMKKMLFRAAKNTPYIGFVIEPYSLFLFFKLKDIEYAKSMLPDRYELAKTKLFADEEPDYYMGIGNLNTRASSFWGMRQESYLIALDKETGLLSFIFIDILSNTLIAEPQKGIINANCKTAIFTTNSKGDVYVDFEEDKTKRRLSLTGNITNGKTRSLDERLWVMGNTSIAYRKEVAAAAGDDNPFAVIFDPAEVREALDIPVKDIRITENSLFPGLAETALSKAICFPFAQHYVADSPGCRTYVKDVDDLIDKYNKFGDPGKMKTFSAWTIIKQLAVVIGVSVVVLMLLLFL